MHTKILDYSKQKKKKIIVKKIISYSSVVVVVGLVEGCDLVVVAVAWTFGVVVVVGVLCVPDDDDCLVGLLDVLIL